MNRTKLFVKNIFVYGFGGVISKLIPLIMVPIITRLMPSSFYFGISDLSHTIISLFSALAIMGMYDAMYRMFFEKEEKSFKKEICSSAFSFTLFVSIIVAIAMIIFQKPISSLFYSNKSYGNLVILCAMSVLIGSTNTILSAPTRMQNKWKVYLVTNTISPIISYSIAIPLLLAGYYLIALPLANLLAVLSMEVIFFILNKEWFGIRSIHLTHIKAMLKIALPLLPNFIIYWIFNSSDRVMITHLLGADYSGVYAVGAKIGQISQLIYLAFAGGWQFFAFSIMKDKDNVRVISRVFELLAACSFLTTIIGTSVCKFGVEMLFKSEYWACYMCIPYLYLAPLLLMLFQIGSNQFLVIKKTWPNLIILSVGALVNVLLNFILIPMIGIEGASIATFLGYLVSISLCIIVLVKIKLLHINARFILNVSLFFIFFFMMRLNNFTSYQTNIPIALFYAIIEIILYEKEIIAFKKRLFSRTKLERSEKVKYE